MNTTSLRTPSWEPAQLDNDGPDFNGDLNSILGPLTILQRAGQGTIILNDKANKTIATPKNVISSSVPDPADPTGLEIKRYDQRFRWPRRLCSDHLTRTLLLVDPFNPPALFSTISVTLVGADAAPTTLPPAGKPFATYTITGTLAFGNVAGQPNFGQ